MSGMAGEWLGGLDCSNRREGEGGRAAARARGQLQSYVRSSSVYVILPPTLLGEENRSRGGGGPARWRQRSGAKMRTKKAGAGSTRRWGQWSRVPAAATAVRRGTLRLAVAAADRH